MLYEVVVQQNMIINQYVTYINDLDNVGFTNNMTLWNPSE